MYSGLVSKGRSVPRVHATRGKRGSPQHDPGEITREGRPYSGLGSTVDREGAPGVTHSQRDRECLLTQLDRDGKGAAVGFAVCIRVEVHELRIGPIRSDEASVESRSELDTS